MTDYECVFHFNPRSPRGERRCDIIPTTAIKRISIHAPREGSDRARGRATAGSEKFQSTLPARGATIHTDRSPGRRIISIHAPREGSDNTHDGDDQGSRISIHAPREGSDSLRLTVVAKIPSFQSTLPARGATIAIIKRYTSFIFQSTLPARGATLDTT